MKPFFEYQLYIFDLDNTLYNENEYLFGGYRAIASKLGDKRMADYLIETMGKEGKAKLFDKMIQHFGLGKEIIPVCLEVLRTYPPGEKFTMYPDILALLEKLNGGGKQLAILTNGNAKQQKNKAENIHPDLSHFFPLIVFANEIESKPSPKGIYYIIEKNGVDKEDCIFIGDDPSDELTAKNAGVDFIYTNELCQTLK